MARDMAGRIFEKNMNMISASILVMFNRILVWYKRAPSQEKCQPAISEEGWIVDKRQRFPPNCSQLRCVQLGRKKTLGSLPDVGWVLTTFVQVFEQLIALNVYLPVAYLSSHTLH